MINTSRKNSNYIISNSIESEIGKGNINGASEFSGIGERNHIEVNTNVVDLWGGTNITPKIPNQSGGERMVVISSNHDDRLGGTGIRRVEIDYLDAIGYERYEAINMNGTALVRTVGTNIRFINAIHAIQVGPGTVASGDVSIFAEGTMSKVYNMIGAGNNMSLSSQRMIPYGKTFFLHEWGCSSVDQSNSTKMASKVRLRATTMHGTRILNTFLFTDTAQLNNSTYSKTFSIPKKVPQLSIIKVTTWVSGTAIYTAASYSGCLETN